MDFIHRPYVLQPQRFKGCFFPRPQVKPTLLGPVDRASLYRWSTEIIIDRSNTAPSSKTFREEPTYYFSHVCLIYR
jgi:hypothetical protein